MNPLLPQIVKNYDQLKYALLEAQTFHPKHFGFPPIYYDIMETDRFRIGAFRRAFEKYDFHDKVVCEAGVGRLALTKHFLPKVKKAYLIENNPELFDLIKKEISKNGWSHKVELIFDDALKIKLPEKVDFIIGEMMSIFCANEFQMQVFRHLRKYLKPDGKLLPEKIYNTAQLAYADFENGHKHYPIFLTRHLPVLFSVENIVNIIDLYSEENTLVEKNISIVPVLSGKINAIYMRSFVQIADGCNFTGTDSLMPPTVCKLENEIALQAGEEVELKVKFEYGTSLDEAQFVVE